MEMTDREIAMSYRTAKHKRAQIPILADLNACSKDKIKAILKSQGVTLPGGDTTKKHKEAQPEMKTVKEEFTPVTEETQLLDEKADEKIVIPEILTIAQAERARIPRYVIEVTHNRIDELSRIIADLQRQTMERLDEQSELEAWLKEATAE